MIVVNPKNKAFQPIVYQPIDNPFVNKFVEKMRHSIEHFKIRDWNERFPYERINNHPEAFDEITTRAKKGFTEAIDGIHSLGYTFPISAEEICKLVPNTEHELRDSLNLQLLLNQVHRYFTTCHRDINKERQTYNDQDYFFIRYEHRHQIARYLYTINDSVHDLENFIVTPNMKVFNATHEYQIVFDHYQPYDPTYFDYRDYFVDFSTTDYHFFTDQLGEYDMWVPWHQIEGKCYWDSYFAHDDPTQWDCSENIQYTGSIALGKRTQARDANLERWLKQHGIKPGPLTVGAPIAVLISGHKTLEWLYSQPGPGPHNLIESVKV